MRDVVSVANVGQTDIFQVTKTLLQREVIRQSLAGMLQIAKRVNHGNAGVLRHAFDGLLIVSAQYNRIHPAFEIMRDVAKLFSRVDSFVSLVHKKRCSAQAGHAGLKCQTRAQRRLLEKHGHLFASQRTTKFGGQGFHQPCKVQNSFHLWRIQIARRNQVARPESLILW